MSDWQITIPEIGPIRATHVPYVVITSNQTRDLSDALCRRCLYLWIDYPSFEKELAIVRAKVPGIDERLAREICAFMQFVRRQKLEKAPGIAETLDWAAALVALHRDGLDTATLEETVGLICKQRNDVARLWSGGTRIGECLRAFLDHYGDALLNPRTVVVIVSDGWDTGDIELLEASMQEIHRRVRLVVWLNPLLGSPNYEPTCRGMQAALPYIDLFAPAYDLESLRDLVRSLTARWGRSRFGLERSVRESPWPGASRAEGQGQGA
ncbi:hypothetical protein HRbin11_00882 [bacterium HR11]|nr:hypothetical protein HRbin11_00882 [bacterium HR11]